MTSEHFRKLESLKHNFVSFFCNLMYRLVKLVLKVLCWMKLRTSTSPFLLLEMSFLLWLRVVWVHSFSISLLSNGELNTDNIHMCRCEWEGFTEWIGVNKLSFKDLFYNISVCILIPILILLHILLLRNPFVFFGFLFVFVCRHMFHIAIVKWRESFKIP